MTDNENAKALECSGMVGPIEVLYREKPGEKLVTVGDVVGLLNRQKAEIEGLWSELIITRNNFENAKERYDEAVKISQRMNEKLIDAYKKLQTAKSEAYKEFAERLNEIHISPSLKATTDRLIKELSEVSDNA